jgi:hypothetical protein
VQHQIDQKIGEERGDDGVFFREGFDFIQHKILQKKE